MMRLGALGWVGDERSEPRDAVHHQTRARHADGQARRLLVVNISAGGLMARCDTVCAPGDRLQVDLPILGATAAEVRWCLGGRIGCRLLQPLAPERYRVLLDALRR